MAAAAATVEGVLYTKDYEAFQILDPVTDEPLAAFVGAKLAGKALPGDGVRATAAGCELLARADHPPLSGVVELASKTRFGMTSRGIPIYLFVPANRAYPPFIVGCSEKNTAANQIGLVKFDHWDTTSQFPRGALQRLLGPVGTLAAEEEALLWQYSPVTVHKEPGELAADDCPARMALGANGLDNSLTFNIDPVGCRDVDDVITVELGSGSTSRITITIADVAARITELSYQDMLASIIGQTLYKDGAAVRPMLHHALSEDALSLLPGKERLGVSLSFDWDGSKRSNSQWHETALMNQKTYTYEEAAAAAAGEPALATFAAAMGGSADAHIWIEEAMKLYNLEAAKLLVGAGVGILRAHAGPDLCRLEKYCRWDAGLAALASTAARYCHVGDTEQAHHGLGAAAYCHATSPIRRYADLMNQRLMKQIIRGKAQNLVVSVSLHDLNARAKAAKAYERDLCYARALSAGSGHLVGRVLDIVDMGGGRVKLRIWVEAWRRTVTATYKGIAVDAGWLIKSRDEKIEFTVAEGDLVGIDYAANMNARRWKERLVIAVTPQPSDA